MTETVTAADGTRIAYEVLGEGAPVVLIGGMFCHRPATAPLAALLATGFRVVNYDRRGRGESGDTAPYAVAREVEDLAALLDAVGGSAAVYGHSSGAGLALEAAGAGVAITRLVLHEPPYGPDDAESEAGARALAEAVARALDGGRPDVAIATFLEAAGLPPEAVAATSAQPSMQAVAPSMPYDLAVMGNGARGGTIPEVLVRAVAVPTLVIVGSTSPAFFRTTAERLVQLLAQGQLAVLEGHDHGAPAAVVAPVVAAFLAAP